VREQILAWCRRLRARAARVRASDAFLEAFFALGCAAAVFLLAERVAFELGLLRPTLSRPGTALAIAAGIVACAGIAAFLAARRTPSVPALAWAADRTLQTEALLLSAVEIASRPRGGAFEPLVLRAAERESERLDPQTVVPLAPLRNHWAILLVAAAFALLSLWPPLEWPAPIASFSIAPPRGAAPLVITARETCIGPVEECEWDFGDGTKGRGTRLRHPYERPGRYTVTLTARGPGGEATATREAVEVLDPGSSVAEFSAEPRKGRAPLMVAFRNASRHALRFRWSFGDGSASDLFHPVHTYEKPGKYRATLAVEGEPGSDEAHAEILVLGPDAPMAAFGGFPTEGEEPLSVSFEDQSSGKISEYEWDFGDPIGEPSAAHSPIHVYRLPGTYTVKLRVKGPGGEDLETREHYIRVGKGGDRGGGGGGGQGGRGDDPASGGPQDSDPPSPYGDPRERPSVDPIPVSVSVPGTGPMVEKVKRVYTGDEEGPTGGERPLEEAYGPYRKAAEEALDRETIPESERDFVRRYFEAIRP